jgi:hypothetical protein
MMAHKKAAQATENLVVAFYNMQFTFSIPL